MLNPYFQQGSRSEQNLIQDLINEQLRMYGVEVHYLPRKYLSENTIIREVIQSKFDDAYPIEAYVDNFDGYGDNTTILSKFGIQATNEITLINSKERFETYISPLIKNEENIKLSTRPKEGDLIYFPLGDRLFESKFVEHEKPFYQLQKNYVYELRCELYRIGDEVIDTGIDEIDDVLTGGEYDGEGLNIYSDATLQILSNNLVPKFQVFFKDVFPYSLSTVTFDATDTDIEYFTAEVSFKYTMYNIVDMRNRPL